MANFFSNLFRGKPNKRSEKHSPEVEAIFHKLENFLKTPSHQNEQLPAHMQEAIARNPACDVIAGAEGVYGRSHTNPIPANGPLGQALYLSSLRINGTSVMFHRLGSISNIDIFESVSLDGAVWDVLFLSLYYPRRSTKPPSGYSFDESIPMMGRLFGTTSRVEPFPQDLYEAVRLFSTRAIGLPLPNKFIRETLSQRSFIPPETHKRRIDELVRSRMTLALTETDVSFAPP